ncbi:hypothetical protein MAR_022172, partial [Mya arenaria]
MIEYLLWQTEKEIENQLRFRQHVLQQDPSDKTLFNFTKTVDGKKKNRSVDQLIVNLKNVVHHAHVKDTSQGQKHILVGKRVRKFFRNEDDLFTWYNGKVVSH